MNEVVVFIKVYLMYCIQGLALQKSYTNLSNTLEQALGDQVLNGKNSAVSVGPPHLLMLVCDY